MYRKLPELPVSAVPAEFVYLPKGSAGGGFISYWLFILPIAGAMAPVFLGVPGLATIGFLAGLLVAIRWWKARTQPSGVRFRVTHGVLVVVRSNGREQVASCALDTLDDVILDTRSVQKVVEGNSAIPAVRFSDTKVLGPIDETRIVLRMGGGREVPLTERYLSYGETIESFGNLRSFLRKHGWNPRDERLS